MMNKKFNFQAQDRNIQDLFTNNTYIIPDFQRPYSWSIDEIENFWNDFIEDDYLNFIGSFVFCNNESGKFLVVDGQQRLITLTIFFAALRDFLFNQNVQIDEMQEGAYSIQNILIENKNLISKDQNQYRLILSEDINDFFKKYIQDINSRNNLININNSKLNKEQGLIINNYNFFKKKIEEKNDKDNDPLKVKDKILERILGIKTIKIEIEHEDDAYAIFEIVNARGVDLAPADLLKNLIFKNIKKYNKSLLNEAKNKWDKIEQNVEEFEGFNNLSRFIRHFWLSKYSFVSENKLYSEIKKNIKESEYNIFLNDLYISSEWYYKFYKLDRNDWYDVKSGHKIFNSLQGIRAMGINQCYVLFLTLLRNINKIHFDISYYFSIIEEFSFKYSAVCKMQANKVEKVYSKYSQQIENILNQKYQTNKNLKQNLEKCLSNLKAELKELLPTDDFFKFNFEKIVYKDSKKNRIFIKYILSKINSYLDNTKELKIDFDEVNIEHIYPKKSTESWNKIDQNFINNLGNLTLLSIKSNSRVGNRSLKDKFNIFKDSNLNINKELVKFIEKNNFEWTEKQIIERLNELINISLKVWSKLS